MGRTRGRRTLTQWMQSEESYAEWEEREQQAHENLRRQLIEKLEEIKNNSSKTAETPCNQEENPL